MSKQQYRSEFVVISDVLRVIAEYGRQGTIITTIARRANLSHYAAIDRCQNFIDSGLIESKIYKHGHIFVITEKGMQFFIELEKFRETIQAMNIIC